jgi:uncharacterized membrane protein YfcA
MVNMEIVFGILVIVVAYFIKGFSGFGPALIIVPFFAILYDPPSALVIAALFDFFAGLILVYTVRKEIRWPFVFSMFIALALGVVAGTHLLDHIPAYGLKKVIGAFLLIFSFLILFQKNGEGRKNKEKYRFLKYPSAFVGGFLGGLVSMSGPPIIIYMKMMYEKSFFRTQLIAIFVFGTAWRYLLFVYHDIPMNIPFQSLVVYFFCLLAGLWLGTHLHVRVNEVVFNKTVALILLIPAFGLLIA